LREHPNAIVFVATVNEAHFAEKLLLNTLAQGRGTLTCP
jgi:hypothetical protein